VRPRKTQAKKFLNHLVPIIIAINTFNPNLSIGNTFNCLKPIYRDKGSTSRTIQRTFKTLKEGEDCKDGQ